MSRLTRKTNEKDYIIYCEYIEKTNELFEQFNKPLGPEEYYKEEPYKMEDRYCLEDAMNRLGKLEDLLQECNINSIQELENLLASKFIAGGFRSAGKTIVAKGMLYNKLSEELGCPLEVVFKALEEGIIYETEKENKYVLIPNLIFAELLNEDVADYHFINYDLPNLENNLIVKLSDYQKTWWLKGGKNNE